MLPSPRPEIQFRAARDLQFDRDGAPERDAEALVGQLHLQVDAVAFLSGDDANLIVADMPSGSLDPCLNFLGVAGVHAMSPSSR